MRLINVKTYELEEFLDKPPNFAILSHPWGHDSEELTFRDVEEGRVHEPGVGSAKLLGSCRQVVADGLGYVRIDTCYINKTNLVELSEAINSMSRLYKGTSLCYAYLWDVPDDDRPDKPGSKFRTSRWPKTPQVRSASVAQRMSWAAGREAKRKEDIAYCLLGIFGVTMPMIYYGEGGEQAFPRLQEQITKKTKERF
ncbi:hypothetical protein MYCTH_2120425 [Thermothelomyces thermophilus ATCC 42464]|uniref:Heterokaryon incompatibility domain-containing protein n=1 Tax=Thermothelomyces thermophilus (strain ATCC 42464 / BCRC 31852 / DSM 1799) TaxID=573729 RepID=G2QIR9_THET4|nr:uncharacterized protein MYCTH_2120425 [Thermothelomyces thermophilus ATCC 42464]AEO60391.1 hypothetical protein MYCTH_2120425 [Thermothelomyces thermophilus ATCC 42464]